MDTKSLQINHRLEPFRYSSCSVLSSCGQPSIGWAFSGHRSIHLRNPPLHIDPVVSMEGIALCGTSPISCNSRVVQSSCIHCGLAFLICVCTIESMINPYKRYLSTKRATSKGRGIPFDLTMIDLRWLLYMANIDIADVGKSSGKYVLSRLGDQGGYTRGNVRFIPCEENSREAMTGNRYGELSSGNPNGGQKWKPDDPRRAAMAERNRLNPPAKE